MDSTPLLSNKLNIENRPTFLANSVLSADFISRSYIPCIGNTRVDYLCRSTISSIVHLFVSYVECRANAFIYQRSTYGIGRYMFFLSLFVLILSTLVALSLSPLQIIFSLVLVLFLYNLLSELFYCRSILTIHFPFLALLCQFSWIFGFACATLRAFYPFGVCLVSRQISFIVAKMSGLFLLQVVLVSSAQILSEVCCRR